MRYPTNTSADGLDRHHHQPGESHRPKQAKPCLRTGLRIRSYSTRIIIRSAGNNAGSRPLAESPECVIRTSRFREASPHVAKRKRQIQAQQQSASPFDQDQATAGGGPQAH